MAPNERARKTHEQPFPGHVSALAVTDPELIDVFDKFAFDEALRGSQLDVRTRLMLQLAAMIACQALREYRVMLGAALDPKNGLAPGDPARMARASSRAPTCSPRRRAWCSARSR